MTVNFTKNQEEITSAWRDVIDSKESQKWALFGYEGNNNIIKLMAKGSQGLDELVQEFNCSLIQYAFSRVIDNSIGLNKVILINWQGDSAPLSRKGLCASHLGDVTNYFKGCSQTIIIRNDDEATSDYLMDQIKKNLSSRLSISKPPAQEANDRDQDMGKVGAAYSRPDVSSEIPTDRKSFWQRQEEEEKQRLADEKKRAAEKQAQFEKERKIVAESEAKKLAETIMQRERMIDATRVAEKSLTNKTSSKSNHHPPSGTENVNNKQDKDDADDERVGRRSELIRLERNQETLSLISKGSIKNKRAIFEQASQQQQQQQPILEKRSSGNFSRRSSGQIITQRLSSLNLHNETHNKDQSINEKLTNGNNTCEGSNPTKSNIVKKHVETVKVTNNEKIVPKPEATPAPPVPSTKHEVSNGGVTIAEKLEEKTSNVDENSKLNKEECKNNNNNTSPDPIKSESPVVKEIVIQGQAKLQARALYDYQAGDNTEISFDPDDIIGYIEKVDPGWWHGSVITGKYKGQCGLFPANYVQELK